MNKITFELEPNYLSKLTEISANTTIEDKVKEIVVNYLNSVSVNQKPNKPVAIDRRILGV